MTELVALCGQAEHAFFQYTPQRATTPREGPMADIEEIIDEAARATEKAHSICARLDRTVFRDMSIDPSPQVWLAHHITNQAFKALIRSRQAAAQAKLANLRGEEIQYNRFLLTVTFEAELATYLASAVELHTNLTQGEVAHGRTGKRGV